MDLVQIFWPVIGFCLILHISDVAAAYQPDVISLENSPATLSLIIPNNEGAQENNMIQIARKERNGTFTDILYLLQNNFGTRGVVGFENRLSIQTSLAQRRLQITFDSVTLQDAGTYVCNVQLSTKEIADCGQRLVIVRKPDIPTISVLETSSLLVDNDLVLVCNANSRTLPPDHNLAYEVWWQDEEGGDAGLGNDRITVNQNKQLVISRLRRSDKNLAFKCITADEMDNPSQMIKSDPSTVYQVLPEYGPRKRDIKLEPMLANSTTIQRSDGESVEFTCSADCYPDCQISWSFQRRNESSFQPLQIPGVGDPSILKFAASRLNVGWYRCQAMNMYGLQWFEVGLEVMYLSGPVISIGGELKSTARIGEGKSLELTCRFDSFPAPTVIWKSPSLETLQSHRPVGPETVMAESGVLSNYYTSSYTLSGLQCEDAGVYACQATNDVTEAEGRINVEVICPFSSDNTAIPLQPEYIWQVPNGLMFEFVVRGFPSPEIYRVISTLNGVTRVEDLVRDVRITKKNNYEQKPYLTLFKFSSVRPFNVQDAYRKITLSLRSSEFEGTMSFIIMPRGPPSEVRNITVVRMDHHSADLAWLPSYNGGEDQTFAIHVRPKSADESQPWTSALSGVSDSPDENGYVTGSIKSLGASTEYVVRVYAVNLLGNSSSEITMVTAAAPSESLGAGAIVGIVFAVLFVLLIGAFLFYWFVYRKKWGKDVEEGGESRKPMLPEKLTAIFKKKDNPEPQPSENGGDPPPAIRLDPVARVKNMFTRKPKSRPKDYDKSSTTAYLGSEIRDLSEDERDEQFYRDEFGDDNNDNDDDDDDNMPYSNAQFGNLRDSKEHVYANVPLKKQEEPDAVDGDTSRTKNDDGLTYVTVDFKNTAPGQPRPKKDRRKGSGDASVDYTDIDMARTQTLKRELEEEEEAAGIYDDVEHSFPPKQKQELQEDAADNDETRRRREEPEGGEAQGNGNEKFGTAV